MVTARDMEKVVSLLRRIYNIVVIDYAAGHHGHDAGLPR